MTQRTGEELTRDYEALYKSYVSLRREVEDLSTVREIGLAINSTLDLDETLTTIANVVHGALDISKLTIYELDDSEPIARPVVAKYGRDLIGKERLQEEEVYVQGTALGEAIAARRVVLQHNDFQRSAFIPLIAKSSVLGVMRLEDPDGAQPFTEQDAGLFHLLGSQIAIAINNAHLYAMAVTDGLTRLYVRRYFDLRMEEEFDQAKRYDRPFSVLLLDVDHFKKFNDTYGHQVGDVVLQQVARLIQDNTRRADICCRYGGEEMAVILPETALQEAAVLANKLCARIRERAFGSSDQQLHVTVSIGVAEFHSQVDEAHRIVKAADEALYRAKELGRNRVELAGI
jgi:diguanylate cyclase (GGDEF)-like protein